MPQTEVVFYREGDDVPVLDWLTKLMRQDRQAYAKCRARIALLEQAGHQLRRPIADILQDGLYELRARKGTVQYRMLYFFHGSHCVVLAHSFAKRESAVPATDIERALARKTSFENDPEGHTYYEEEANDG